MEGLSIFCLILGIMMMLVVVVAAILYMKRDNNSIITHGFWRLEAVGFVFSMAFIFISLMTR